MDGLKREEFGVRIYRPDVYFLIKCQQEGQTNETDLRPYRYGGSSAVVRGNVVLDLHRMKKIVEINEEYCYAIVEPGVTFFDLYDEVKRRGLKLWPSAPALGWGSIVGNALERGFGYTPEGEHAQMQCGMEVVLSNGDLLRTGMGSMEENKCWPLFKGYVCFWFPWNLLLNVCV